MKRSFIQTLILLFSLILLSVEAYSAIAPTRQARYIGFTNKTGTSVDVSWNRGNGSRSVLLVKEFTGSTTPSDIQFGLTNGDNVSFTWTTHGSATVTNYSWAPGSSTYTSTFTPSSVGSNTNFAKVMYDGTGNTIRIQGLNPGSKYLFKVLEYNEGGTPSTAYATGTNTANPRSVLFPGLAPSSSTFSSSASSASISWPAIANNVDDWGYYFTVNNNANTALADYDGIDIGTPAEFGTWYLNGSDKWASWEVFDLTASTTYHARVQGYSGAETTEMSSSFTFWTTAPPAVNLTANNIIISKVNSSYANVSPTSLTFTEADVNTNLFKVVLGFDNEMDINYTPSITFTLADGTSLGSNTVTNGNTFNPLTSSWSSDSKTFTQFMSVADQNVNYNNGCLVAVNYAIGEGGGALGAPVVATQVYTIDTKSPNATDYVASSVSVDAGNTDINVVVKPNYWNASNKEMLVGFGNLVADDGSNAGGTFQVEALVKYADESTTWTALAPSTTFTLPSAGANTSATFNRTTNSEFASFISNNASRTITQVRARIWDINKNTTNQNAYNLAGNYLVIDITPPVAYTVTGPTAIGGTVQGNYFNNTNETVRLTVNLPNDATLTSSTISIYSASSARSNTWTSAGWAYATSHTISVSDLNTAKTLDFTKANLVSSYTPALEAFETANLYFKARITEPSGNYTERTFATRTFSVDLTPPSASTTGDIAITSGNTIGNDVYWNNTSSAFDVSYTLQTTDASLNGGTAELLLVNLTSGDGLNDFYSFRSTAIGAPAANNNFNVTRSQFQSGYPYYPPTTNVSRTVTAYVKITDAAGNSTTYTASSKTMTIDESAPYADGVTIQTLAVNNTPPPAYNANISYWNNSSTLGTVTMNLPADNSLIGGTVQLVASKHGKSWATIGSSQTITALTGNTATFSLAEFSSWWGAGFATANPSASFGSGSTTVTFRVDLTDAAGNRSYGTGNGSAKTYEVDNKAPVIGSGSNISTITWGWQPTNTAFNVTPGYWNKQLDDTPPSATVGVTVPLQGWATDQSLLGGTVEVLAKQSTESESYDGGEVISTVTPLTGTHTTTTNRVNFTGATFVGSKAFYANGVTANFWAKVTDRAGNTATFTANNSMPIDYTAPTQMATGDVDIYKSTATSATLTSQSATFTKYGGHEGVYVYVQIPNDESLVGGYIDISAYKTTTPTSTYTLTAASGSLSPRQTINSGMLNNTSPGVPVWVKLDHFPSATFPSTEFAHGNRINFIGIVTDKAGNTTTFTSNSRQMYLNLTYPSGTVTTNDIFVYGSGQLNGTPVVSGNSASYSWNANSSSFTIWGTATGIPGGETRTMRLEAKKQGVSSWTTLATWSGVGNGSQTFSRSATDFEGLSVYENNKFIDFRFALNDAGTGIENYSPERTVFVKRSAMPSGQTISITDRYWNSANQTAPANITGVQIPTPTGTTLHFAAANGKSASSGTITTFQYQNNSAAVFVGSGAISSTPHNITVSGSDFAGKSWPSGTQAKFNAVVKDYAGNEMTYGNHATNRVYVDVTAPTANINALTAQGGIQMAGKWNNTNEWLPFSYSFSDANSTIDYSAGNQPVLQYSTNGTDWNTVATFASSSTAHTWTKNDMESKGFGQGNNVQFRITAKDQAGNTTNSSAQTIAFQSNTFTTVMPFATGTIIPGAATYTTYSHPGYVSGGYYYNNSHTKAVNVITVPISADINLTGGFIKYQFRQVLPTTGSWTNVTTVSPSTALGGADLNTSKTFELTNVHTQLTDGNTYEFRALIVDQHGNVAIKQDGGAYVYQTTPSTNSIRIDRTLPTAIACGETYQPVVTTAGGTLNSPSNYIREQTDILKVYLPVKTDASLAGGFYDIYAVNGATHTLLKRFPISASISQASGSFTRRQQDGGEFDNGSTTAITNYVPYSTMATGVQRIDGAFLFKVSNLPADAKLQSGTYKYYAKVIDAAGNESTFNATCNNAINIDLETPTSPTFTSVAASVGNPGFWNRANVANPAHNMNLAMNIPNFSSLESGTVTVEATTNGTTWGTIPYFGSAGTGMHISAGQVGGPKTISIPSSSITAFVPGFSTSAASQTITFRAKVTTVTGKPSATSQSSYTAANSIVSDQTNPFSVVFNTVTPTGGNVKAGFWNNSNTGVQFGVTLPTDASLVGGSVYIRGNLKTGSGSSTTITGAGASAYSNTFLTIPVTLAQYTGGAWYSNNNATTFTAFVTDVAGNSASFSFSGQLFNKTAYTEGAITGPTYSVSGGTLQAGYFNGTNTGFSLTGQIPLQAQTYGIVDMANTLPGTLHWWGERTWPTAGTLALGNNTAINIADINNPKTATFDLNAFVAANSSSFTEGSIWRFYGVIEDFAGNYSANSLNSSNLIYDQTTPSSMTTSGIFTGAVLYDGSTDNGVWNTTCNSLTITTTITDQHGIYQYGTNGRFWAQFTKDGGTTWVTPETYTPVNITGVPTSTQIVLSGSSLSITAADQALGFRIVGEDPAKNIGYGSYNNSHTIRVALTPPSQSMTGTVTVFGGNVVRPSSTFGYWNATNQYFTVDFPVTQEQLRGGRSYLWGKKNAGAWTLLGLVDPYSSTITVDDYMAQTKTLTVNSGSFSAAGSAFGAATNDLVTYQVSLVDINGNSVTFTPSSSTISVDLTPPSVVTISNAVVSGGNVVPNYWNGTNTLLDLPIIYPADNSLAGGSIQFTRYYTVGGNTTSSALGGPLSTTFSQTVSNTFTSTQVTSGIGTEGGTLWWGATVTDVAGNSTVYTPSASSFTLDLTPPVTVVTTNNPYFTTLAQPTIQGSVSDNLTDAGSNVVTMIVNPSSGAPFSFNPTVVPGGGWFGTVPGGNALPNGWHSMTITSVDLAGNTGIQTQKSGEQLWIVRDNVAPVITINSNNNADPTPVITGTISDITNTNVWLRVTNSGYTGLNSFTWDRSSSTAWSYTWNEQLTPGSYTVTGWGFDQLSLASSTVSGTFTIPTSLFVTVNAGQQFNTSNQTITGTVTSGATVVTSLGSATVTGTTWSINTNLADGMNQNVSATATYLGATEIATGTVNVDYTAPLVGLTTTNMITNAVNPTITGTTSDATSGVANVNVFLTGPSTVNGNALITGGNWTVTFNGLAPQGNYNVAAVSTDNLGNSSTVTGTMLLDQTGPVVTFVGPTFSQGTTPTLYGTWSDNYDSAPSLTITLSGNGGVYYGANVTLNSNSWTITTSELTRGVTYTVTPSGKDAAGNSASSVTPGAVEIQSVYTYFDILTNGDEATTISSLANTTPVEVWEVSVVDNANGQNDNIDVNITGIVITQGANNTATDWSEYLNSADLYLDDQTTLVGTGTINANNITFTGLNYTVLNGQTGYLDLKITLKQQLPAGADGKMFQFVINNGNVTVGGTSTPAGVFTATSANNMNVVDVTGTAYAFTQQPVNQPAREVAGDVKVARVDANGNVDKDFTSNVTITPSATLFAGTTTRAAVNGVATFNDLNFDAPTQFVWLTESATNVTSNTFTVRAARPTTAASNLNYTARSRYSISLAWTNGNGSARVVVARESNALTADENPADGTIYANNNSWNTATNAGNGKVVFRGTTNAVTVDDLQRLTTYYFAVFEYNTNSGGDAWSASYRITGAPTLNVTTLRRDGAFGEDYDVDGVYVSDITPNPAFDNINFRLDLVEKSTITVEIRNIAGQLIATPLSNVDYIGGTHNVKIALNTNNMSSGAYIMTVTINGGESIMKRFVVQK